MTRRRGLRTAVILGTLLVAQALSARGDMLAVYFSSLGPSDIEAKVENAIAALSLRSPPVPEEYELAALDVENLSIGGLLSREQSRRLQWAIIEGLGSPRFEHVALLAGGAGRALSRVSWDALGSDDQLTDLGIRSLESPNHRWRELAVSALAELNSETARRALEAMLERDGSLSERELIQRVDERREMFEIPSAERCRAVEARISSLVRTASRSNRSSWAPRILDLVRVLEETPGAESTKLLRRLWKPSALMDAAGVKDAEVGPILGAYLTSASQGSLLRRGDLDEHDPGVRKLKFAF